MGIGNSREPYAVPLRRRPPSPRRGLLGGRNYRRGYFRQRRYSPTTQSLLSHATLPVSYQPLNSPYYANRLAPIYPALGPMASPYLPISYNNYSAPPYMPPQYMMPPQRIVPYIPPPAPALPPPMSIPYVQQPQVQPVYNNLGGIPAPISAGAPVASGLYPPSYPSYPSAPVRFVTDWTGGGKISPGFLGPPI